MKEITIAGRAYPLIACHSFCDTTVSSTPRSLETDRSSGSAWTTMSRVGHIDVTVVMDPTQSDAPRRPSGETVRLVSSGDRVIEGTNMKRTAFKVLPDNVAKIRFEGDVSILRKS